MSKFKEQFLRRYLLVITKGGSMKLNEALRKVGRDAFMRGYLWRHNEIVNQLNTSIGSWFNEKALRQEFDSLVRAEMKKKK